MSTVNVEKHVMQASLPKLSLSRNLKLPEPLLKILRTHYPNSMDVQMSQKKEIAICLYDVKCFNNSI